jgi:group I intron endonuclease
MIKSHGIIYRITCKLNGKQYIGQTTRKNGRWIDHRSTARKGRQLPLYNAIRKYGETEFEYERLQHCHDQASLDLAEESFIKLFNTMAPHGYNMRAGGGNGKFSDAAKATLKVAMTRPEMKRKIATARAQPEYRTNMSIALKAAYARPEAKARQDAAKARPEYKIKRAATLALPEVRARISETAKAVAARPGVKTRMSEAAKAAYERPEVQAKQAAARARPEVRAKQAAARARRKAIAAGEAGLAPQS